MGESHELLRRATRACKRSGVTLRPVFTGIVSGLGCVVSLAGKRRGGARLVVGSPARFGAFEEGESICVSGICLTAVEKGSRLVADLSSETLRRSTLGVLRAGQPVNLERALAWGDRLSGHFVLGHVDAVSRLLSIEDSGNSWTYRFSIPAGLSRFIVEKGSLAVDGVSLTVAARRRESFDVAIVPETRRRTTLAIARPGDRLNLEVDVFARYGRAGWRRRVERTGRRP
jgi:riboflavin synthase